MLININKDITNSRILLRYVSINSNSDFNSNSNNFYGIYKYTNIYNELLSDIIKYNYKELKYDKKNIYENLDDDLFELDDALQLQDDMSADIDIDGDSYNESIIDLSQYKVQERKATKKAIQDKYFNISQRSIIDTKFLEKVYDEYDVKSITTLESSDIIDHEFIANSHLIRIVSEENENLTDAESMYDDFSIGIDDFFIDIDYEDSDNVYLPYEFFLFNFFCFILLYFFNSLILFTLYMTYTILECHWGLEDEVEEHDWEGNYCYTFDGDSVNYTLNTCGYLPDPEEYGAQLELFGMFSDPDLEEIMDNARDIHQKILEQDSLYKKYKLKKQLKIYCNISPGDFFEFDNDLFLLHRLHIYNYYGEINRKNFDYCESIIDLEEDLFFIDLLVDFESFLVNYFIIIFIFYNNKYNCNKKVLWYYLSNIIISYKYLLNYKIDLIDYYKKYYNIIDYDYAIFCNKLKNKELL